MASSVCIFSLFLVLLVLAVLPPTGIAWTSPQPALSHQPALQSAFRHAPNLSMGAMSYGDLEVREKDANGRTALRFGASTTYATSSAPKSDGLAEFFFRDEQRDLILAGGNGNLVEHERPTLDLMSRWGVEAERYGAMKPKEGDDILRVTATGIEFPGLRLKTVATVGCKKLITSSDSCPQYQFTLIKDELQAEGPDLMVWTFNQLTGGNKSKQGPKKFRILPMRPRDATKQDRKTHSINVVTAKATGDGVVFRSSASIQIEVTFPTVLRGILPVSKAWAERTGSRSISRVVERDIGPSLDKLRNRYIQWLGKTVPGARPGI